MVIVFSFQFCVCEKHFLGIFFFFLLFSFYLKISKGHLMILVVMKHYFYLSHVRMAMYDCRQIYVAFYCSYCYSTLEL